MNRKFKVIIFMVVLLSLTNLVYIFFIANDNSKIHSSQGGEKSPASSEASNASISFSKDTIYYNGQGELDLMYGVTATDADGSDATDKVFIAIKTGSSPKEKVVRYALKDCDGAMCYATRALYLEGYEGPSITVTAITLYSQEDLSNLLNILIQEKAIYAYDGYSNDITDAVSCDYSTEGGSEGYKVTFTVTNSFNDVYSCSEIFQVLSDGPTLALTTDSVTIALGESFNPKGFIADALDPIEGDLRERVIISGHVNTSIPGTYYVSYYAENSKGEKSVTRNLRVVVQ